MLIDKCSFIDSWKDNHRDSWKVSENRFNIFNVQDHYKQIIRPEPKRIHMTNLKNKEMNKVQNRFKIIKEIKYWNLVNMLIVLFIINKNIQPIGSLELIMLRVKNLIIIKGSCLKAPGFCPLGKSLSCRVSFQVLINYQRNKNKTNSIHALNQRYHNQKFNNYWHQHPKNSFNLTKTPKILLPWTKYKTKKQREIWQN